MGTVLEVRDIIRNYSKKGDGARPSEDDIKVIRGLSLKVEKKDFLGIMGKSGCGMSQPEIWTPSLERLCWMHSKKSTDGARPLSW